MTTYPFDIPSIDLSHRHRFTSQRDRLALRRIQARQALRRHRPDVFVPFVGNVNKEIGK